MKLAQLLQTGRTIRVLGVDDAHYADKSHGSNVDFAAVVCGGTRFEGMLWGSLDKDGMNATQRILKLVRQSKFADQLHLVLLDGITFGGCNVIDLPLLAGTLKLPSVAVMRRVPNMQQFRKVVDKLPESDERWRRTQAAGKIHQLNQWVFQCCGEDPVVVSKALSRLTDRGKVPEVLRLAHLIGSAVMMGESTNRV